MKKSWIVAMLVMLPTLTWGFDLSSSGWGMFSARQAKVYGPEIITAAANRVFSSDTGFWTKSAGVTMSGGSVSFNVPTSSALYKLDVLTIGLQYTYTFTIVSISSGGLRAACGTTGAGTLRTAPGTYTEVVTATTKTLGIMSNGASTVAEIDNVSFRRKY